MGHCLSWEHPSLAVGTYTASGNSLLAVGCLVHFIPNTLDYKYTIKDMVETKYFLGIEICRTATGTHLSKRKYILDLLQDSGLTACKLNPSPLLTSLHLSLDKGIPLTNDGAYRSGGSAGPLQKMRNIDPRDFCLEIPTYGPATVEMINATKESFDDDDLAKFQELLLDEKKPLYKGCLDFTKLSAIVKQLNLKGKYGASDKFFTELLGLLKKDATYWQKKAFNGQQELQHAPNLLTGEQIYNEQRYWRHNSDPHCIDFMHVEKNICESLVRTLLNVPGKTKDEMNARLDLAELGIKPELFARHEEDKTTLPPIGYILTNAEKDIFCETLSNIRVPQGYCSNFSSLVSLKDRKLIGLKSHDYHMLMQEFLPIVIRSIMHPPTRYAIIRFCFFFKVICRKEISLQELDELQLELVMTLCLLEKFFPLEYHKTMKTIGIPPDKHVTNENEDGKPLSAGKSSEVSGEVFQKAHLYVIHNTYEIVPYIERHKQVLKTKNPGKRIALLDNEHSKYFAKWLCEENTRVSVEAVDLHISKEVATIRKAFYYGVLQEIWVLDYRFRQIPLFEYDWVNHKAGGVKHDPNLGYTLVDLNSLGHKDDLFILSSQAQKVFYVKDQIDKKLSIVFRTPTKNYKDTYDEVDEEFSTVIHEHHDNILPRVNQRDLGSESQNDCHQTDCEEPI
uniref:DUF4216 domain-containing protein n=1 Tax=Tanacetum cinerariifolium TaxID=118510 RepID=A0A699ITD1_TANCI|nr:hypothetical protein [Tanacetum cinerariifolium]